jgi:hypothetical protein
MFVQAWTAIQGPPLLPMPAGRHTFVPDERIENHAARLLKTLYLGVRNPEDRAWEERFGRN